MNHHTSDNLTGLVTGGAGYVGSHVVLALRDQGFPVTVIDNLSSGLRSNVPDSVPLIEADVTDKDIVSEIMRRYRVGALIHIAGSVTVAESLTAPVKYYKNNSLATLHLAEASF